MRVLIVGDPAARGGLAAARALGTGGWFVGAAGTGTSGVLTHSRWVRARHRLPPPADPGLPAALAAVVRAGHYETLFVTGDDWLAAVVSCRDRLPVPLGYAPTAAVLAVLDKLELGRLAVETGLRVPRTVVADGDGCASWVGPAVVKARSHAVGQGSGPRTEAVVVGGAEEARTVASRFRSAGVEPLLQEVVDGELIALTLLVDRGRPVARVQQRAGAVWPRPAGVSARAVTVPVDETLAGPLTDLLAGLSWSGLAQAQFLAGPDGPVLIDVNPRYYGSMALAAAAGTDLPGLWAALATGRPVQPVGDAAAGVRYTWLEGDLRRALAERRGGLRSDVADTLRWARGAVHSIAARGDPAPLAFHVADLTRRAAGKAWRKMAA